MINKLAQDIIKTAAIKLSALDGLKNFFSKGLIYDFGDPRNRLALSNELKQNMRTGDLLKPTLAGSGIGAGLGGLFGAIRGYRGSSARTFRDKLRDALRYGTRGGLKGSIFGGLAGASYGGVKGLDSAASSYYNKADAAAKDLVDLKNLENNAEGTFKNYKAKQDGVGSLFRDIEDKYVKSVYSNPEVPTSDIKKVRNITSDIMHKFNADPQRFKPFGDILSILSNYEGVPSDFTRSIFSHNWLDLDNKIIDLHNIGNKYNLLKHKYDSTFEGITNNPYLSSTLLDRAYGMGRSSRVRPLSVLSDTDWTYGYR